MASYRFSSLRHRPACRLAARLALLLFALRAVLPAGYMPDLGALQDGQVQIVICTGTGTQALFVDASGRPVGDADGHGDKKYGGAGDCAFGMAMAKAVAMPAPMAALPAPPTAAGFPPAGLDGVWRAAAEGPPLGPRAPPILLA